MRMHAHCDNKYHIIISTFFSKANTNNIIIGKLVVENDDGHSIPTDRDFSKEEPPPIPSKYSTVSYTNDVDYQDYIQPSASLNKRDIPPKLPPKTYYTHL